MPCSQNTNNRQKPKMELPMEALPALVLLHIAKHLPTDDARNLSLTCKRIMNILPIYPPPLIIRGYNFEERQCEGILGQKWDGYFQPKRYFQSPLLESKIDQIQMTMKWKDQVNKSHGIGNFIVKDHCWRLSMHCCHEEGWGNKMGHVWLQLFRPSEFKHPEGFGGKLEYFQPKLITEMKAERFGIAPHEETEVCDILTDKEDIVKLAKPGDFYQIMKNIGGGGGHQLSIKNFQLKIFYKPYLPQRENCNLDIDI